MICGDPNCKGGGESDETFGELMSSLLGAKSSPETAESLKTLSEESKANLINHLVTAEDLVATLKTEKSKAVSAVAMLEMLSMVTGKKVKVTEIVDVIWEVLITAIEEREKLAKQPTSTPIGDFQVDSSSVGQKN
jgi:hypothetical protein